MLTSFDICRVPVKCKITRLWLLFNVRQMTLNVVYVFDNNTNLQLLLHSLALLLVH